MENWNILEILKLGLPGLVFLLSMLSYRLLSKEQDKKMPSTAILRSIKGFMQINVVLAIMTLSSPVVDNALASDSTVFDIEAKIGATEVEQGKAAVCFNSDYANRYLLVKDRETNKLIQVFATTLIPCTDSEQIALNKQDIHELGWSVDADSGVVEVIAALPGYKFAI